MLLLAYRNLRTRPACTLFTALAIALGVGMIFAMRIVGVTINQSAKEAREGRLAGADLEVTIATGANLNVRVMPDLTARPEVDAAAPVYRALEGGANTHGELAVQAALAMREGLAYVNQKRAVLGQPTLAFGMG